MTINVGARLWGALALLAFAAQPQPLAAAEQGLCDPESAECSADGASVRGTSLLATRRMQTRVAQTVAEEAEVQEVEDGEDVVDWADPQAEDGVRALLSKRSQTTGGCKFCSCLVTSAVECGTDSITSAARCGSDTVTSGALCGWKTITSASRCGESVTKMCDARRRRRGKRRRALYIGKIKCSVSKVAKSCKVASTCNVPKTCSVPKSCNVGSSFSECLEEITGSVGSAAKPLMKYIKDTGCTSINACKNQVTSGLGSVVGEFKGLVKTGVDTAVKTVTDKVGGDLVKWANMAMSDGAAAVSAAKEAIDDVGDAVADYLDDTFPPFQKFDLPSSICTPAPYGLWYMDPTDCGAFSSMAEIFTTINNAETHFNNAADKVKTCATKTGLLKFPTPFFDLKWQQLCMPQFFISAVEYLVGAAVYGASAGLSLFNDMNAIIQQLLTMAKKQLPLLELGRTLSARQAANGTEATLGAAESIASECGSKANWAVDLGISLALSAKAPDGSTFGFEFGTGISIGCKSGTLRDPNWILRISFGAGQAKPSGETSMETDGALEVSLAWSAGSPEFTNRGAAECNLDITPEIGLKVGGVDVSVASPVTFVICPDLEVPSGFSFGVAASLGAGSLLSVGRKAQAAAKDAPGGVLGAVSAAAAELARADLRAAVAEVAPPSEQLVAHGEALAERGQGLVASGRQAAAATGSKEGIEVDVEVRPGASFTFCITPDGCKGQR